MPKKGERSFKGRCGILDCPAWRSDFSFSGDSGLLSPRLICLSSSRGNYKEKENTPCEEDRERLRDGSWLIKILEMALD